MPKISSKNSTADWRNETIAQTRHRLRRKWGDYPLTILIINPINIRLARLIGRTSITPNQLTVFSFLVLIAAAYCLASLQRWVQVSGGFLVLIAYLFDCLDGDLARLKGLKSPLGAMLDPMLDRFGEFAIILGVAINGWRITQDYKWLIGGILLVGMSQIYFYLVDAMLKKLPEIKNKKKESKQLTIKGTRVRIGAIEPFMWGQAFLAFFGVVHWGIFIFGVMFTLGSLGELFRIIIAASRIQTSDSERFGTHMRQSSIS
jgi:phosphatidylglycerophosphate synthase